MEMMRKALEYCQSPIYGVEGALERERSSDRERISEGEKYGSRKEWSPTQEGEGPVLALCSRWCGSTLTRANGGYGFTSVRWRQQGCCQTASVRKHQYSRKKTFISAGCNNQRNIISLFSTPLEGQICQALWKMTSGDDNLQTNGKKTETYLRDNGKWSLWQKEMMKIEKRTDGPAAVWGWRVETRLLVVTGDVLCSCPCSTGTKMLSPAPEDTLITVTVILMLRVATAPKPDLSPREEKTHRLRHTFFVCRSKQRCRLWG